MQQVEIPIRDNFDNAEGRFRNYDAVPRNQREQLYKQAHVDIRGFRQEDIGARVPMLYIDLLGMSDLDLRDMSELNGTVIVNRGEQWTQGTVQKNSDRNNAYGLTMACVVGTNTTKSVMTAA